MSLKKKLVWVTFLVLDTQLHKTSQIEMLKNLSKMGYNPTLIAIQSKNRFNSENFQFSIIPFPLRSKPIITSCIYAVLIFFFLPFYILFSNPDFIIIQPTIPVTSFFSMIPISRIKRVKIILDIRTIPVQIGFRGFLQNLLFASSILIGKRLFDGMTIITPSMKQELSKRYNIKPDQLGLWSSGVSPSLFNPKKWISAGLRIRKKFFLTEKFVVFYHGALSLNRGLLETVKAIKKLKKDYPEIVLFLLGSGPLSSVLKEFVKKEHLQSNVIIHDSVDYEAVPKYISMSDVAIIPLPNMDFWRYQSPLKLLEYLAMKKVVITSDISAHRVVIGKKTCGIYMSSVNDIEIAKTITYALINKDKLKNWGEIGRLIIQDGYTWQKIARNLEDYMLSIE